MSRNDDGFFRAAILIWFVIGVFLLWFFFS